MNRPLREEPRDAWGDLAAARGCFNGFLLVVGLALLVWLLSSC